MCRVMVHDAPGGRGFGGNLKCLPGVVRSFARIAYHPLLPPPLSNSEMGTLAVMEEVLDPAFTDGAFRGNDYLQLEYDPLTGSLLEP